MYIVLSLDMPLRKKYIVYGTIEGLDTWIKAIKAKASERKRELKGINIV